jgi:hypothetical protein
MLVQELKLQPSCCKPATAAEPLLQHVSNIANSGRNPHQQEQNKENDEVNGSEDQNNGGKDNQRNVEDNV